MNLCCPLQSLFPSVEASALQALVSNPGARSGREVARLAGVSHPAASRALDSLWDQGVVDRERAGRAHMYKLNDAHLATACIRDLVGLRSKLVEAIRQDMATWEQAPLHASLFGSVARDGGTRESDIDLLIVRPADVSAEDDRWREQVDRLSERIFGWTGNHTGVSEIDPDDLQNPDRGPSSGALREARRDGIQLAGMSLGRLLMGPAE